MPIFEFISLKLFILQVEDVFVSFSKEPLGTASLAQVHKATTKDGKVLAVKIQHPKVKAHSYLDIRTMEVKLAVLTFYFLFYNFSFISQAC
jgi:aarF domain-containing kinase